MYTMYSRFFLHFILLPLFSCTQMMIAGALCDTEYVLLHSKCSSRLVGIHDRKVVAKFNPGECDYQSEYQHTEHIEPNEKESPFAGSPHSRLSGALSGRPS